ncbi:MAG TPA: hypothetical protein P5048_04950, partial [Chlamydiales bacterium]|nr:hypothetical protein [Chlamydiales bacterium]
MQKRKNWQLFLILAVTILTIYNILPTIFFYSKPLKKPIDAKEATKVSLQIAKRVNSLEKSNINWIKSYCDLLSIKASDINFDQNNPEQIAVSFSKEADANKFKNNIQRAGALISFPPAQLSIDTFDRNSSKTILVQRKIPVHFNTKNLDNFFSFTEKKANNEIASLYSEVILDRSSQLALTIVGTSDTARLTTDILETKSLTVSEELILSLAHSLTDFVKVFGENSTITSRYFASFTQDDSENKFQNIQQLINKIGKLRSQLKMEKIELSQKENLDVMEKENNEEHIALIDQKEKLLLNTETLIKRHSMKFSKGENPWNIKTIQNKYVFDGKDQITSLPISQRNALINKMYINWNDDSILLELHPDVIQYQNKLSENDKNLYNQIIINEIASLTRKTNESIQGNQLGFSINLNSLSSSNSMLVLKLDALAKEEVSNLISNIKNQWNPTYSELTKENFPIVSWEEYKNLSKEQQSLCLIVYAPIQDLNNSLEGFNSGSIYVIPKGVNRLIQKFQKSTKSAKTKEFFKDLYKLQGLLARSEMNAYLGEQMNLKEFQKELVFEKSNYYRNIIQATRENFKIHGSKRFATLEFTDYEQRLLTLNKIETNIHEDLIKWKDEYHAAQVNIDLRAKYDVPAPTQNILMNNLKLSVKKYFRGDERKILHWGLDLSGGKTVQIELRDQNNQIVTNEEAIKQGINELYTRVNKMGVSDVNIRQVDTNIVLDFPGSQNLSAQDLIKASSMFFHVVNEKFSTNNRAIADSVQRFLQEVWNEAVVTNKKDAENINLIAWSHLYGDSLDSKVAKPRTEA